MLEWVPVILSFCVGALRPGSNRPMRVMTAGIGVLLAAVIAFITSGEYAVGRSYFFLDLLQALLGLLAGILAARSISRMPGLRKG